MDDDEIVPNAARHPFEVVEEILEVYVVSNDL